MRYALRGITLFVAVALTGCSAWSQLHVNPSGTGDAAMAQNAGEGSWIDLSAKAGALLYVTGGTDVDIFTWPKLRHAGLLTGFQQTSAACVDGAGNVWIGDAYAQKMYEYPHGSTTAIATLDDDASFPNGCTVNKRDGTLAVGNEYNNDVGMGSITIYPHAAGSGVIYYDPALDDVFSLDYAPNGNLFYAGWTGRSFGMGVFARKTFTTIVVKGASISYPGGVQYWKTLTVGDAGSTVAHPTIYRMSDTGRVRGKTVLGSAYQTYQYDIRERQVICACYEDRDVQVYPYPAGQTPTKTVTSMKQIVPWAAVVSPPVTNAR